VEKKKAAAAAAIVVVSLVAVLPQFINRRGVVHNRKTRKGVGFSRI
jgi:hypothetical protein